MERWVMLRGEQYAKRGRKSSEKAPNPLQIFPNGLGFQFVRIVELA
jgi:hypothetical protein